MERLKPLDPSSINIEANNKIVEKCNEVRDNYLETLKVGETMLRLN